MEQHILEVTKLGFELLFFRDDFGFHFEILENDLYILSGKVTNFEHLKEELGEAIKLLKK